MWTSYDQNFRASLATGLTRWGWTDWNAATGQRIRYHWLSEATAGLISRVTGIDEFDSVTRLLPILGVLGVLLVGTALLKQLGVHPFAALVATTLTASLHQPFSVYSIGTLWGTFLGWGVLFLLATIATSDRSTSDSIIPAVGISIACVAVLLSQSTMGVTIAVVVGVTYLVFLFTHRIRIRQFLFVGIPLIVFYALAGFTILRGPTGSATEVTRIPVLWHGIIGLPDSFKEAFTFWLEPIPQSLLVPMFLLSVAIGTLYLKGARQGFACLFVGAFLASVLIVINVIRIGGYEERFVREGIAIASLFGIGGLMHAIMTDSSRLKRFVLLALTVFFIVRRFEYWQVSRSADVTIEAHVFVILIVSVGAIFLYLTPRLRWVALAIAALALGNVIGFFHESVEKNLTLATRDMVPLSHVNGDAEIDECMAWVRANTAPDTVIASNMWRIPRLEDQKYFLVSQKTKRRVVVDGPDYLASTGAFPERSELERLKNVIDDFVSSPSLYRLNELQATSARYLIVDQSRPRNSRLGTFVRLVEGNDRCSVYAL